MEINPDQLVFVDSEAENRIEAKLDQQLVAFTAYQLTEDSIIFTYTVVIQTAQGHGVGAALLRKALEMGNARKRRILALCPFMQAYLHEHPELREEFAVS